MINKSIFPWKLKLAELNSDQVDSYLQSPCQNPSYSCFPIISDTTRLVMQYCDRYGFNGQKTIWRNTVRTRFGYFVTCMHILLVHLKLSKAPPNNNRHTPNCNQFHVSLLQMSATAVHTGCGRMSIYYTTSIRALHIDVRTVYARSFQKYNRGSFELTT